MDIIEQHQTEIQKICQHNNVGYLGVFGSTARGEDTQDSDVDLLVSFNKRISLFDLIGVEQEFETALSRKVDLITIGGLNAKIKPYVLKDLKTIYGKTI